MLTKKQPSPSTNPANQLGLIEETDMGILSRFTGTIPGKATFNTSDRPLLIEALTAKIFRNPSIVRCYLFSIKSRTFLNKR